MSTPASPSPATVTMIAPDGSTGDVPVSNIQAAQQSGFKVGIQMQSPDGKNGYIPADRVHDAASSGFKMVPLTVPDTAKASYWDALTNPVGSGAQKQGVLGAVEQTGGQAIKALVQPVAHPLDTLEGLYNSVRHPISTLESISDQGYQDAAQGGLPLALENAVGQLGGAVESGRVAGGVMGGIKPSPVLGPVNDLVPSFAKGGVLQAMPAAASRALLLGRTPEAAYESALKPSTTLSQAERANVVDTGLQNSLPVSKAGVQKLNDLIDDFNQKISDTLQNAPPNRSINPQTVAQNLTDVRNKFANQVNPTSDLNAIDASGQEFLQHQQQLGMQRPSLAANLTPQEAQAMKQGTYRVLAGKYGEQGSAAVEAQKALARGLKEEIATQFPEIGNLNAAESKLLDLQPVLERAVARNANHQFIGIGTPAAGIATEAVTGSTTLGKVAMGLKAVLDNPAVKSRLAIALSKGGGIPYAQALARVQSYSTSLGAASSVVWKNSSADTPNQQ